VVSQIPVLGPKEKISINLIGDIFFPRVRIASPSDKFMQANQNHWRGSGALFILSNPWMWGYLIFLLGFTGIVITLTIVFKVNEARLSRFEFLYELAASEVHLGNPHHSVYLLKKLLTYNYITPDNLKSDPQFKTLWELGDFEELLGS